MHAKNGRNAIVAAFAAAILMVLVGVAHAAAPLGEEFRVSVTGTDLQDRLRANDPAVAYSSKRDQYLVVWYADTPQEREFEIFVQAYTATGTRIGSNFKISRTGPDGNAAHGAISPAVAYNSTNDEYLVVWYADPVVNNDHDIYGQRVSPVGAPIGGVGSHFRISNVGVDGETTRAAGDPAIAYNETDNEYLVTWYADGLTTDNEYEIFGQRVSNVGTEIGSDFRISTMLPDGTSPPDRVAGAFAPAVAYSPAAHEYLAVWYGDGIPNADEEYEIFGQRIAPITGSELVSGNFAISQVGGTGSVNFIALNPAIAYNSTTHEFLVAWWGHVPGGNGELEIYGQRVVPVTGSELVSGDFRISSVGSNGDKTRGPAFHGCPPLTPDCPPLAHNYVAYNAQTDQYLVTWTGNGLSSEAEYELFGQTLSTTGAEVGGDFQLTSFGTDETYSGDPQFRSYPFNSAVAARSDTDEYLLIWEGNGILASLPKNEVWGCRLPLPANTPCRPPQSSPSPAPAPAPAPAPPAGGSSTPKALRLSLRAARFQRALKTGALLLRVTCNERCTLTATTRVSIPGASKTFRLKSVRRTLAAGKTVTLKIKLTSKVKSAARRALKKRKRVTATVNLVARDTAGKRRTSKRVIRIRR